MNVTSTIPICNECLERLLKNAKEPSPLGFDGLYCEHKAILVRVDLNANMEIITWNALGGISLERAQFMMLSDLNRAIEKLKYEAENAERH